MMMTINTVMISHRPASPTFGWRLIRFVRPHRVAWGSLASGSYASGETAGFPPEIAAKVVDIGAAVYLDEGPLAQRYRTK